MEEKILKHHETVENELKAIHKGVAKSWYMLLLDGTLHGAGFVVGTVLSVALLGWALNLFGVIPGLGAITATLREILDTQPGF